MAKKKTAETANIKAAPVLRAQSGGEQPTPTPEQTETRTYQIMDPWKDRGVVNLVDVKAVDGEITEVKVNGEPAGGSGGGTATVQITNNNSPKGVNLWGPIIYNNVIMTDISRNGTWLVAAGSTDTFTVPLATGGMQLYVGGVPTSPVPVITGGCTWDVDNQCFIITSDCSITI